MTRIQDTLSAANRTLDPLIDARRSSLTILSGALLLALGLAQPAVADTAAPDASDGSYRSQEGPVWTAAQIGEALSLPTLPDPAAALTRRKNANQTASHLQDDWYLQDTWITDIGVLLYNDADDDAYFAGFSLSVDADSIYTDTDVYLSIDMQRALHPVERLHISHVFPLYGQSAADEYRIDIELLSNHVPDHYDLIIELRDAYNHQTLDRVDASDFSNLHALPLESNEYDDRFYEPTNEWPGSDEPFYNDDVQVAVRAGSAGWLMVLAGSLALLLRRTRAGMPESAAREGGR
ncbi:choice-of-anchor H family protein [Granulosicoccus sp. 3-233]|uniref:choice-of-anchor H family protein n=1 Tax=Granulosicoccus sp. 3-233 TaxID=3417969 RepID=UPI003D341973